MLSIRSFTSVVLSVLLMRRAFSFAPNSISSLSSSRGWIQKEATIIIEEDSLSKNEESIVNCYQRRKKLTQHHMAPSSSTQLNFRDDDYDDDNNDGIQILTTEYSTNVELAATSIRVQLNKILSIGTMHTVTINDHRSSSLGCTIEESLNEDDPFIFISNVKDDGNAQKSGLEIGDVIVGVTGTFGKLEDVLVDGTAESIERLVLAVPEEEPLSFQVVRGTKVLERHESAIVDACNYSRENEKEIDDCLANYVSEGYKYDKVGNVVHTNVTDNYYDDDITTTMNNNNEWKNNDDDATSSSDDDDDDDDTTTVTMIQDMMELWADELPLPPESSSTLSGTTTSSDVDNGIRKKPKPWSSRSSGSGTYVRDPKTGQMRNIDAVDQTTEETNTNWRTKRSTPKKKKKPWNVV